MFLVCAWCCYELDSDSQRKRKLSQQEYMEVSTRSDVSHGMCASCKAEHNAEIANYKRIINGVSADV